MASIPLIEPTHVALFIVRWRSDSGMGQHRCLVEGQLKLFLSVWYNDYSADLDAIRDQRGKLQDPDGSTIEPLRQFFVKRIWTVGSDWNPYVQLIQQRRNTIHAFKARDIGSFDEWKEELRRHLSFIRGINGSLPYPDDIYEPREK